MDLTLARIYLKECTFGIWLDDKGLPIGIKSIELPWKNNKLRESCIPAGVYECVPFKSPSKGEVWLLKDTAPRSMIEIHVANFTTDILGCIAPGLDIVSLKDKKGVTRPAVSNSAKAMQKLKDMTNYGKFRLIIV